MVLLISELAKIGATKPIFLDSGSPRGKGGFMHAWAWFVIFVNIVNLCGMFIDEIINRNKFQQFINTLYISLFC